MHRKISSDAPLPPPCGLRTSFRPRFSACGAASAMSEAVTIAATNKPAPSSASLSALIVVSSSFKKTVQSALPGGRHENRFDKVLDILAVALGAPNLLLVFFVLLHRREHTELVAALSTLVTVCWHNSAPLQSRRERRRVTFHPAEKKNLGNRGLSLPFGEADLCYPGI
jgi:hypothetical protein